MMDPDERRQAKKEYRAKLGPPDPDRMILHAQALQAAARRKEGESDESAIARPILLALAAEIALKAWQVRERKGAASDRCHDLVALFDKLSADAQERLQARMPEHPWPLGADYARLSGDPFGGGIRVVLEFHRDTFEDWRYGYEHLEIDGGGLFAETYQLDEALTTIIETYNPPRRISIPLGNMAR